MSESVRQSVNNPVSQSVSQSANQSVRQSLSKSVRQTISESVSQSINQSVSQSVCDTNSTAKTKPNWFHDTQPVVDVVCHTSMPSSNYGISCPGSYKFRPAASLAITQAGPASEQQIDQSTCRTQLVYLRSARGI